jgi:hypothetical protein
MSSTMRFVFIGTEWPQCLETNHPGLVSAAKGPAKTKSGHAACGSWFERVYVMTAARIRGKRALIRRDIPRDRIVLKSEPLTYRHRRNLQ